MYRASLAGPAEDVQVLARIDRDARDLAEIHVWRQLEKVGARVETDLRNLYRLLLRAGGRGAQYERRDGTNHSSVHGPSQCDVETCVARTEWNTGMAFVISGIVPTETRAYVGSAGKNRPIATLCFTQSSLNAFASRRMSIIMKFASD